MKNTLLKIIVFNATIVHGDTLVWDRWRWIKSFLPITYERETLLDVGCGSGAFTIGAALRGYNSTGLSWDESNLKIAKERAKILNATGAKFIICDARKLDQKKEFIEKFDFVVNTENIEHILDDKKLIVDIAACMKAGGRLLLTTPNINYYPMTSDDIGPFSKYEDGGHVRRGYSEQMLRELCEIAGLKVEKIEYCSGFVSQKVTAILRILTKITNYQLAWIITFPLRPLVPLLDKFFFGRGYSICLYAYKPRFMKI